MNEQKVSTQIEKKTFSISPAAGGVDGQSQGAGHYRANVLEIDECVVAHGGIDVIAGNNCG